MRVKGCILNEGGTRGKENPIRAGKKNTDRA